MCDNRTLSDAQNNPKTPSAKKLYEQGNALFETKDYKNASIAYQAAIALHHTTEQKYDEPLHQMLSGNLQDCQIKLGIALQYVADEHTEKASVCYQDSICELLKTPLDAQDQITPAAIKKCITQLNGIAYCLYLNKSYAKAAVAYHSIDCGHTRVPNNISFFFSNNPFEFYNDYYIRCLNHATKEIQGKRIHTYAALMQDTSADTMNSESVLILAIHSCTESEFENSISFCAMNAIINPIQRSYWVDKLKSISSNVLYHRDRNIFQAFLIEILKQDCISELQEKFPESKNDPILFIMLALKHDGYTSKFSLKELISGLLSSIESMLRKYNLTKTEAEHVISKKNMKAQWLASRRSYIHNITSASVSSSLFQKPADGTPLLAGAGYGAGDMYSHISDKCILELKEDNNTLPHSQKHS